MPYGGSVFSLMKKRRAIDPTRMGFGTIRGTSYALNLNPELSGISLDSASGPTMQEFLATRPTMSNLSGEPVATSQVVGKPPGGHHQGFPDMTKSGGEKGLDSEGMLKALEKHESAGPAGWASMGKPGGTGGGGFKLFPNSMVENMASSGPLDLEQQKKDWWERYLRSIA